VTLALISKRTRSAATGKGVLTYDTAATGSIPLQPVLTKEEIELLSSLIPSPVSSDLSPLQAVQYQLLRKWFDEGEIGWAEFLMLSAGGAGSVPSPDTSYATPIVFHLVRIRSNICISLSASLILPTLFRSIPSREAPWYVPFQIPNPPMTGLTK
jgi:hypothetical protein